MRQRFEDSFKMNTTNWKINRKINSIRTYSSRKAEFLSKFASFLPIKFGYANYIFAIESISSIFYDPKEYWF